MTENPLSDQLLTDKDQESLAAKMAPRKPKTILSSLVKGTKEEIENVSNFIQNLLPEMVAIHF